MLLRVMRPINASLLEPLTHRGWAVVQVYNYMLIHL